MSVEDELEKAVTRAAIELGVKRTVRMLLRAAKEFQKAKKCPDCGSIAIPVGGNGKRYGWITCACRNPRLKKLLKESVRVK